MKVYRGLGAILVIVILLLGSILIVNADESEKTEKFEILLFLTITSNLLTPKLEINSKTIGELGLS